MVSVPLLSARTYTIGLFVRSFSLPFLYQPTLSGCPPAWSQTPVICLVAMPLKAIMPCSWYCHWLLASDLKFYTTVDKMWGLNFHFSLSLACVHFPFLHVYHLRWWIPGCSKAPMIKPTLCTIVQCVSVCLSMSDLQLLIPLFTSISLLIIRSHLPATPKTPLLVSNSSPNCCLNASICLSCQYLFPALWLVVG